MKMRKAIALSLAIMILVAASVMGTIAWLTDTTGDVVNTFTVGNIDIELWENELDAATNALKGNKVEAENKYKIVPGKTQPKNPTVTVKANSDACWVFVTVKEENSASTYVTYSVDTGNWTQLKNGETPVTKDGALVYYRDQAAVTEDTNITVLTNSQVSYSQELTKGQIDYLYTTDSEGKMVPDQTKAPKLTFKAYAIQKTNSAGGEFTPAQAWAQLNPTA